MTPHDDNSPLSERAQQAIRDGEAAWVRISSGDWDISAWQVMGAALTLLRAQVLRELDSNVARGSLYNKAFADRVNATKFATMETVTRSNLLFLMEPEIRVVLDRLLASWTPAIRAKRTHPTTLAQYVRKELKPPPPKQPKPAPSPQPAAQPAPSTSEVERLRKRVAELEAAAATKAAPSSPAQAEAEAAVPFPDLSKLSRERLEREVYKARFQAQLEIDRLKAPGRSPQVRTGTGRRPAPDHRRSAAGARPSRQRRQGATDQSSQDRTRSRQRGGSPDQGPATEGAVP